MDMSNHINRMKVLVEVSKLITNSGNFFDIKDDIISKMLEVVHPTKACINLFYKNDYDNAYLVCSKTLDYISNEFPMCSKRGTKINIDIYPEYIHEAINDKKIIYIEDVFKDKRAEAEIDIAIKEGYIGRIVFPLIVNSKVVGFMTCFLAKDDKINQEDIDFISSVSSLISLSIEISDKNDNMKMVVNKLRGAINSISEATKKLYANNNINEFLEHISKSACNITNSKEALVIINESSKKDKVFNYYTKENDNRINIYPYVRDILCKDCMGEYENTPNDRMKNLDIKSYIYYKLKYQDEIIGTIVCSNSKNYTNDDLNILSILAKQVALATRFYEYNAQNMKSKLLSNELDILSKQQKLIMNESILKFKDNTELYYYHKSARVVGGDFYYAIKKDNKVITMVADVMGHGIVSNYVVAMLKGAFKVLVNQYDTPCDIMTNLNSILYDEFDKMGVFTTCLISIADIDNNIIGITNAGHYSPIMILNNGEIKRDLNCIKGIPIGIMDNIKYTTNNIDISEIDLICMYTDGIIEIKNEEKREYGIESLEKFIANNRKESKSTMISKLENELSDFSNKLSFEDDILLVVIKKS